MMMIVMMMNEYTKVYRQ